jgi:hypothetical protein
MSVALLKSQDILLLAKLVIEDSEKRFKQKDLASSLGITQSEVSTGFGRLIRARLIYEETNAPVKVEVYRFFESAVRYFFPADVSEYTIGMPTSLYASPLKEEVISKGLTLVWPTKNGKVKGLGLIPIHDSIPEACANDKKLYQLISLIDASRTFLGPRVNEQISHSIRKIVFGGKDE